MDLKEFISETLTQICDGVKDAQAKCERNGARVSPHIFKDRISAATDYSCWKHTDVKFKITLQSSDKENGKSGIGVLLANITVGTASRFILVDIR